MITFNELRISDDKQTMYVECAIEAASIYANCYIENIYIDYYKNVSTYGVPSEKAINVYSDEGGEKSESVVRKCVTPSDFGEDWPESFDKGIFYVIVDCSGTIDSSVSTLSCGYDVMRDTGIVIDWKKLYDAGMQFVSKYVNGNGNDCAPKDGFDNFIILWNSLKLSIDAMDYPMMEKTWDRIMRLYDTKNTFVSYDCNCR